MQNEERTSDVPSTPQTISADAQDVELSQAECHTQQDCYYWPILSFHEVPHRIYHFHHQFKHSAGSYKFSLANNFLKGVKWSPDGSCFLVHSEDNSLRIFDLPYDAAQGSSIINTSLDEDSFMSAMVVCEGESIYDFCWYPQMLGSDPATCVFATTTRDHPVHLWDAVTGQLRCSYRAYDAMDEITTAFSVTFNPLGTKLICGYNKTLRVFDTSRPGREFKQYSTLTGTNEGQTGIISCLAFNPYNSGLLAAGSYNRTTALYSEDNAELLYVLHGQGGGVTQVQFSKDGNYLYTGARKDPYIFCWDLRHTAGIVYKLERSSTDTNQRISFDIEPYGRHLGSGGQDGQVRIFDLQTGDLISNFEATRDTLNGFSFHPSLPLAVSSSGHRRFDIPDEEICLSVEENCASIWKISYSWGMALDVDSNFNNISLAENPQDLRFETIKETVVQVQGTVANNKLVENSTTVGIEDMQLSHEKEIFFGEPPSI